MPISCAVPRNRGIVRPTRGFPEGVFPATPRRVPAGKTGTMPYGPKQSCDTPSRNVAEFGFESTHQPPNAMHPKLDDELRKKSVCPLCKTWLQWQAQSCHCESCGRTFGLTEGAWDFRVRYPAFLPTIQARDWSDAQRACEHFNRKLERRETLHDLQKGLDQVREVYEAEFRISGRVLDVGGHQGRLRHFLAQGSQYVSVDPWVDVFRHVSDRPELLAAYPCLREPCNFVAAHAERLPFAAEGFDWVHMRSVVDHFYDALIAFSEARRVLHANGRLLVGVHVTGGQSSVHKGIAPRNILKRTRKKLRDDGLLGLGAAALRRATGSREGDEAHLWHPTHYEMRDLIRFAGFEIEKEHWQKPPYDHVLYVLARPSERVLDEQVDAGDVEPPRV